MHINSDHGDRQADPAAIEQAIQASIRQRKPLKRWVETTGISWAYTRL